jgi:hypothetical protein
MPRDGEILRTFEIADDGMQGTIGYFHYMAACQDIADKEVVRSKLPNIDGPNPSLYLLRITFEWARFYDPKELISAMDDVFLPYHARTALISIIAIFDAALKGFADRLRKTQQGLKLPRGRDSYEAKLKWAFVLAKNSQTMARTRHLLTDCCSDVDHARRIRNLWVHNNGLFDSSYGHAKPINGNPPVIDPEYRQWEKDGKSRLIRLTTEGFEKLSLSHITLLHHVYDAIQKTYFGDTEGYSYIDQKKTIDWHRILGGT